MPADWNRKLAAIQAKAAEALAELPPGFMGQFEGAWGVQIGWLRGHRRLHWVLDAVWGGSLPWARLPRCRCPLTAPSHLPTQHRCLVPRRRRGRSPELLCGAASACQADRDG